MRIAAVWFALLSTLVSAAGPVDTSDYNLIDLSHSYDKDTIYWPTSPSAFELETLAHGVGEGGYFYSAHRFSTPEHGGTHIDAPIHFSEQGWSLDEVPVERFIGSAFVIDVSGQSQRDPDYRLSVADVEQFEKAHGKSAPVPWC